MQLLTTEKTKDPIAFVEQELRIKIDADTKTQLRKDIETEATYQDKVKKLLELLRTKYEGNYKIIKHIDNLIPLYDSHDFWDS
jgi:hypothetical protein